MNSLVRKLLLGRGLEEFNDLPWAEQSIILDEFAKEYKTIMERKINFLKKRGYTESNNFSANGKIINCGNFVPKCTSNFFLLLNEVDLLRAFRACKLAMTLRQMIEFNIDENIEAGKFMKKLDVGYSQYYILPNDNKQCHEFICA